MHNLVFIVEVNEGSILSLTFFCSTDICLCAHQMSLFSRVELEHVQNVDT